MEIAPITYSSTDYPRIHNFYGGKVIKSDAPAPKDTQVLLDATPPRTVEETIEIKHELRDMGDSIIRDQLATMIGEIKPPENPKYNQIDILRALHR
jgi:hypothetical protein